MDIATTIFGCLLSDDAPPLPRCGAHLYLTEVLSSMTADGHPVRAALAASTSPYMHKNIRRLWKYALDMDDLPDPLDPRPLPFDLPL